MGHSLLSGSDAGPALRHQDGVGRGHLRGRMTVEHELALHPASAHRLVRQRFRADEDGRGDLAAPKVVTVAVAASACTHAEPCRAAAERLTMTSTYFHQPHLPWATRRSRSTRR